MTVLYGIDGNKLVQDLIDSILFDRFDDSGESAMAENIDCS